MDEQDPTDISYVFSGYAPLSVRLVQAAIAPASGNGVRVGNRNSNGAGSALNGWKGVEEVLRPLPGATFEDWQEEDESPHSRRECLVVLGSSAPATHSLTCWYSSSFH